MRLTDRQTESQQQEIRC